MRIDELQFKNSYPFDWTSKSQWEWSAKFITEQKLPYLLEFNKDWYIKNNSDGPIGWSGWTVEFWLNTMALTPTQMAKLETDPNSRGISSYGILNTGDAQRVMATVLKMLEEFLKEHAGQSSKMAVLSFSAKEPSRIKLYKTLVSWFKAGNSPVKNEYQILATHIDAADGNTQFNIVNAYWANLMTRDFPESRWAAMINSNSTK